MKADKTKDMLRNTSVFQLVEFYDLLPDILFWIKDTNCNIIYANQVFVEHLGLQHLEQMIGKNDYAFSPSYMAHQFITDDKKVMAGEKVTNRLELNHTAGGDIAWFSTSKRQLRNDDGEVIGTYGLTRHLNKTSKALSYMNDLEVPINYIKRHFSSDICIKELAAVSHLSISALERRFKKHLGKTPKQFINEFRLEQARKLLFETDLPIAQIGFQVGFSEPSYFSKLYKQAFGMLPSTARA